MDIFWKTTAVTLIVLVLGIGLAKQEKDLSVLLTIAVCCMTGMVAISFLAPVFDLLYELKSIALVHDDLVAALIKIVGIALVSELVSEICANAGNSALGKSLQLAASAAILSLAVPIFRTVFSIIQDILGAT